MNGLKHVVSLLRKRDQMILLCRYEDKLTYNEIGILFSITGTRVQQIIRKILRRMCHPAMSQYVVQGYEAYTQMIREQQNLLAKEKYEEVFGREEDIRGMDITVLQLPIRIWNVLNRNNIHTIGDLKDLFTVDCDITKSHIGKRCLKESFEKLQEYGIIEY